VLRAERIEEGWLVRLPWSMPRFLRHVVAATAVAVGMAPIVALQAVEWRWAESLCVIVPMGLAGAVGAVALFHGVRLLLARVFSTRFELRSDGVRIEEQWSPADELPEATQTHRVHRSSTNAGGTTSRHRVDRLHVGDRTFSCDESEAVRWLVDALNRVRTPAA